MMHKQIGMFFPLMLLASSVDTPIDNNRSHLLALPCALRCASCVNGAITKRVSRRESNWVYGLKGVHSLQCVK